MTPLQQFCEKWKNGCGSEYCAGAGRLCFYRGTVPSDVLFVGEAPGESEDALGRPFCGPAGKLLDRIVSESIRASYSCAYTNLIMCIPKESYAVDFEGTKVYTGKAGQPSVDSIQSCRPRLEEFVRLCNPRLIVCVGKLSEKWLEAGIKHNVQCGDVPRIAILHPAFILRSNVTQQGLHIKRAILTIREAVQQVFG